MMSLNNNSELNEMYEASREALRREANKIVAQNKDGKLKVVGDIVLFWDTSRLRDYPADNSNTDQLDHKLLTQYPSVVIADGQRFNADIVLGKRVYPCNLDLIIWNKTLNKKYRTSSNFVKLTTQGL